MLSKTIELEKQLSDTNTELDEVKVRICTSFSTEKSSILLFFNFLVHFISFFLFLSDNYWTVCLRFHIVCSFIKHRFTQ